MPAVQICWYYSLREPPVPERRARGDGGARPREGRGRGRGSGEGLESWDYVYR